LAKEHARYLSTSASIQRSLLRRPRLVAALTRGLTSRVVGPPLAGGWSITWNNLLEGAPPNIAKGVAAVATGLGYAVTARSADRRWIAAHVDGATRNADCCLC